MTTRIGSVLQLLRWWEHIDSDASHHCIFAPHFIDSDGFRKADKADFESARSMKGKLEKLAILRTFSDETNVAVMYEGVEAVSRLTYRYAWIATFEDAAIAQLLRCSMNVFELTSDKPSV